MLKPSIAIYIQYYLTPSMTFIYRQIKAAENFFQPHVICSDILDNTDRFPMDSIYHRERNFIKIKKTMVFSKIYGWDKVLGINPKLSFQQKKIFRNALIKNRINLIHAHFGPGGLEIYKMAEELKIPLLVTFHGYDASLLFRYENYKKNLKRLFQHSTVIAVSDRMKEKLIEAGASKESVYVIRCGIPVEFFNFVEREPLKDKFSEGKSITFLQVSNFVEKKGHKYTLLAYKNFLSHYKNSRLIFAGDGILRKKMQKFSVELGIEKNLEFPGVVDEKEVHELMIKSDVFLHHSVTSRIGDQEGVPTVIMEAMATGLPVISTFHSGIPELITNDLDGFLVNERDIEAYTNTLFNLKNLDPQLGFRARQKIIQEFNLKNETDKLIALYNKLIN